MEYSSAGDEDALFGLAASYLRTAINDRGGEWRATFVIGDEPALLSRSLSAVRRARAVLLRAVAELPVDDRQRLGRRHPRHRGADSRRRSRARRSAASCRAGASIGSACAARTARRSCASAIRCTCCPSEDFRRGELFGRFIVGHAGQRVVPALGHACEHGMARLAHRAPCGRELRSVAARDGAREDLGPAHGAHDVPLRRDDQRRGAAESAVPRWAASSTSRGSTATSCRASTRRAWARASTGGSATSRCSPLSRA